MKIASIKDPEDVLVFMNEHIKYGWLDMNGNVYVNTLKNFKKLYRVSSIEETLKFGVGTCIEQVALMKFLLNKIGFKCKTFCTRIYIPSGPKDDDPEEHMHCFLLYKKSGKIFQLEHPNGNRIGIYCFNDEMSALKQINSIYEKMSGGTARPVTRYFKTKPGLTFKQFNDYINSLDEKYRVEIK